MKAMILVLTLIFSFSQQNVLAKGKNPLVGKVDIQKVLLSVKEGKKVRTKLKKMFDKRQKTIKAEENKIRKLQEKLQKQSAVMNEKTKVKKQRELQDQAVKLQQKVVGYQKEIQAEEGKLKKPIIERVKKIIDKVSKTGNYDMIFEYATAPVYIKSSRDITDAVIKAYDKAHK